jgi:hypothetical protein
MIHRSWVGEHLYGDRKPGWPAWENKSAGVHGSCTEWGRDRLPRAQIHRGHTH